MAPAVPGRAFGSKSRSVRVNARSGAGRRVPRPVGQGRRPLAQLAADVARRTPSVDDGRRLDVLPTPPVRDRSQFVALPTPPVRDRSQFVALPTPPVRDEP